ncbi:MAG: hypothetical protein WD118_07270 [Phycisphaeraceae bacterium]
MAARHLKLHSSSRGKASISALALATLALAALAPPASAQVEQRFDVRLKGAKSWGAYTLSFLSSSYDTDGAATPATESIKLRFPAGVSIRRQFLNDDFLCDYDALNESRDPNDCRRSRIGTGTMEIDLQPLFDQVVPGKVYLFLSKGAKRGAVASVLVLVVPDSTASIVKQYPFVADIRPLVRTTLAVDRRGTYGYRQDLEVADSMSVTKFDWELSGLRTRKRGKKLFWLTRPSCPGSRKVGFEATYSYAGGQRLTRADSLPCSKF